jgi:hypothetical protein
VNYLTAASQHRNFISALALLAAASTAMADVAPAAEYELVFNATWSEESHPQDFPYPTPHFSGLIGGTHDDLITFWQVGELASEGIRQVAELGTKTALQAEVNAQIALGHAGEVISGPGINPSPGTASDTFTATVDFPYASVVSMIAPSPDWFVGVSGVSLMAGGMWASEIVVELYPFDAGTDSGATYKAANNPTIPPEPIYQMTGYPFLDHDGMTVNPLGTFTFRRISFCSEDLDQNGVINIDDLFAVLAAWGETNAPEDVNSDGVVDVDDLFEILAAWGAC